MAADPAATPAEPLHKVARDGAVLGDYTFREIQDGLGLRQLRPTDHVWAPGVGKWIRLGELASLAGAGAGAAAARAAATVETAEPGEPAKNRPLAILGGVGTVFKWVFVLALGGILGMMVEGRSPRRHPENDPLSDPYAGRRDPDFDDPDRDA